MDKDEFWNQCEDLFNEALSYDPPHRSRFVENIPDSRLRAEVRSLLAADQQTSRFAIEESIQKCAHELTAKSSLQGTVLGHFELQHLLGAGGMSEVYLARDLDLGRTVALKLLPPEISKNKSRVARFKQEARAASALNHPHVVTIYEIAEIDGQLFIATEYVTGETLQSYLAKHRMSLAEIKAAAVQIASGLAAAHQAGIVHRDIKPGNVMLRPDGVVKVLDFGLARVQRGNYTELAAEAGQLAFTLPGTVLGTPAYMSPEQCRGAAVDARSDFWSFGVVLYEMLTGQPPFAGNSTLDVLMAVLEHPLAAPSKFNSEVPAEWDQFVLKLLAKNPSERFSSTEEMRTALQQLPSSHSPSRSPVPFAMGLRRKIPWLGTIILVAILAVIGWKNFSANRSSDMRESQLSFSYIMSVEERGEEETVSPADALGNFVLPAEARFRLHIIGSRPGFFYLLGVDHATTVQPIFTSLFPTSSKNEGSAFVNTAGGLTTGWYRFASRAESETLYMIWAVRAIAKVQELIRLMNPDDKGMVTDPQQVHALQDLLGRHNSRGQIIVNQGRSKVTLTQSGEMVISTLQIRHQ